MVHTLESLGAPVKHCDSEEAFFHELLGTAAQETPGRETGGEAQAPETGGYHFAFVTSAIAGKALELIAARSLRVMPVLLAKPGEPDTAHNISVIIMPPFVATVANVLNRQTVVERRKRRGRFIAPDARVLVVDDIQTNLTVAQGLLSIFKVKIDTCISGQDAIGMVQQNQYDIVFMDHMMPGMDGIEATAAIRALEGEQYRTLPIVALTANAISGMREMFLEKGFNDYLSKPVELAKLNGIMDVWIPAHKKTHQGAAKEDEARYARRSCRGRRRSGDGPGALWRPLYGGASFLLCAYPGAAGTIGGAGKCRPCRGNNRQVHRNGSRH